MPTNNPTIKYIKVTNKNLIQNDAIFDATVIANYGDPGLDEDYHFDFLSRYVICMIESSNRTLTSDKFSKMIVAVKRPEPLWIDYQGGLATSPASQKRIDKHLVTNIGPAANYTINAIGRINNPYQLGETIKIKLIKDQEAHYLGKGDSFFSSTNNTWNPASSTIAYYQQWHTQGLNSDAYIAASNGATLLKKKTIAPYGASYSNSFNTNNNFYTITLNKIQYEAFVLTKYPSFARNLVLLFSGQSNFQAFSAINGGYLFSKTKADETISSVIYEDINVGKKERVPNTNCIPLIVTSPNTFTAPAARSAGTVNYTPTYITKA